MERGGDRDGLELLYDGRSMQLFSFLQCNRGVSRAALQCLVSFDCMGIRAQPKRLGYNANDWRLTFWMSEMT